MGLMFQILYILNHSRKNDIGEIFSDIYYGMSKEEAYKNACEYLESEEFDFLEELNLLLPEKYNSIEFITGEKFSFEDHYNKVLSELNSMGSSYYEGFLSGLKLQSDSPIEVMGFTLI